LVCAITFAKQSDQGLIPSPLTERSSFVNDKPCANQQLSVEKLKLRLSSVLSTQPDRLAVLVMSGSFNPVHAQHIRALEAARMALERAGWAVAGGFLAPSSDAYLKGKLTSQISSLNRRIELCGLATQVSDWLSVFPWGEFSSYKTCTRLREQLERECAGLLKGRSLTAIEVMGSDAAIRILDRVIEEWKASEVGERQPWYQKRIICCLIRPSPDSNVQMEHIQRITAPQTADIGVEIILIDATREGLPLEAVSSTEIRELVARGDWDLLRALRWVHPKVLSLLESWARG
jgi:nicotinic acid mononucleotide adenylyltransferase